MPMLAALTCLVACQGIDPELATRYFDDAAELSERDGGALWGHELYGPMLFLDGASGTMVANEPDPGDRLSPAGFVFTGPLGEGLGLANTAQSWGGISWTTVMWPLPAERTDRCRLLAHEMTHRLQPRLGACRFAQTPCEHLDERDGRLLLRLEMRALAAALGAEGEARAQALVDALAARARRHALFPAAHDREVALESNEGVAEYTGVKLCGLDPAAQRRHAAARLRGAEGERTFARSFAYATGPAWGLLIDAAEEAAGVETWRAGFTGTIAFHQRLMEVARLAPPEDLARAVTEALERHDGAALVSQEDERARARDAQIAADRARLVDGPVLVLDATGAVSFQFDPYAVRSLPGIGEVYDVFTASDAWGALEVTAGGLLLLRDEAGSVTGLRVPLPAAVEGGQVTGEGWSLRLAEGWRLLEGARPGDRRAAR